MRYILILVLLFALSSMLQAQFGINGGYAMHRASDWQLRDANTFLSEPPGNGFSVGVDYWFRLKNVRIEFLPELNYSHLRTPLTSGMETQSQWYSLFFNVNFYPFDFKGDCDCPTFSKQGNQLQKGFFLALSPGVSYLNNRISGGWGGAAFEEKSSHIAPNMGIAIGVDIGISDLLTISPKVAYRYYPRAEWAGLSDVAQDRGYALLSGDSAVQRLEAGIRVGWRFNYR